MKIKKKTVIKNLLSNAEMEAAETDFVERKRRIFNINQVLEMQKAKQLQVV